MAEHSERLVLTDYLAPQSLLLAALILILGIVFALRDSFVAAGAVFVALVLLAVIAQVRLTRIFRRSLIVLPIVVTISLFMPLRYVGEWNWGGVSQAYLASKGQMASLILTPWLCLLVMLLLLEFCTQADLLYALERFHLPRFLLLLLNFGYRYVETLRGQLRASHRSLIARAPTLSRRRQVLLYGNLAGSMLVRAHDRGERIHAAMQARGYSGSLPRLQRQRLQARDAALLLLVTVFSFSLVVI